MHCNELVDVVIKKVSISDFDTYPLMQAPLVSLHKRSTLVYYAFINKKDHSWIRLQKAFKVSPKI